VVSKAVVVAYGVHESGVREVIRLDVGEVESGSFSHQLLMAESTKEALRSPHAELVFFDELPIRGRVEPVKLWSVAEGVAAVTVQPVKASSTEGAE